jgi:hypothetical protein
MTSNENTRIQPLTLEGIRATRGARLPSGYSLQPTAYSPLGAHPASSSGYSLQPTAYSPIGALAPIAGAERRP